MSFSKQRKNKASHHVKVIRLSKDSRRQKDKENLIIQNTKCPSLTWQSWSGWKHAMTLTIMVADPSIPFSCFNARNLVCPAAWHTITTCSQPFSLNTNTSIFQQNNQETKEFRTIPSRKWLKIRSNTQTVKNHTPQNQRLNAKDESSCKSER